MSNDGASLLENRIPSPNSKWLAQIHEDILEPDLPIVDPHHHLWDMRNRRYLLDELLEDINSGHNIVATVFLECMEFILNKFKKILFLDYIILRINI